MAITLLYFAGAREAAGTAREALDGMPGATVSDLRRLLAHGRQLRRSIARIGDAHRPAFAHQPAHDRETAFAESEHQRAHQRTFNVERPISTSMMVMIQKRTTTWFSFQPESSKW